MDLVTFFGLIGLLLATIFAAIIFLPAMLIKWRASALGLKLTYRQAHVIAKWYCNKKDFLLAVKDIWFWVDVPIEKLAKHYVAKGDLSNLRDGIIEMRQRNRNIDFVTLSMIDLSGRDLMAEIKRAERSNWRFDLSAE